MPSPPKTVNAEAGSPSETDLDVEPPSAKHATPDTGAREGSPSRKAANGGTAGDEGAVAGGAATYKDVAPERESSDLGWFAEADELAEATPDRPSHR